MASTHGEHHYIIKILFLSREFKEEINDFIDFLLVRRKKWKKKMQPRVGAANGKIFTSPDFDDPLDWLISKNS